MKNKYLYSKIEENLVELQINENLHKIGFPEYTYLDLHKLFVPKTTNFSSPLDIIYQLVDKPFLHTFKNTLIPKNQSIILLTWVIPSGLGDLAMQIHIGNTIKKNLPHINIQLISIIETSAIIPKDLTTKLPWKILSYTHPHNAVFNKEIIDTIAKAFCVIEIPTPYFGIDALKQQLQEQHTKHPVFLRIGEYGFINTEEYNPSTKNRSMGLYFLEKGIISLDKVAPTKRDLNTYFAYLITKEGIQTYLLTILINRNNDDKNITLLFPNFEKIIPVIQTIPFKKYGIKNIYIDDLEHKATISVSDQGKDIHIIKCNSSPEMIRQHMNACNPFIGIRGDGSFTECIATNAIFFYDALDHAIAFLEDLHHIVKNHLYPYFSLYEYIQTLIHKKQTPLKRAEILSTCLSDPLLFIGMEKLNVLIHSKYSFNPTLINLISQSYAFYTNPPLESEFLKKLPLYEKKQISLKSLLSHKLFPL